MKHIKDNIQEITNAAKDIGETYAETGRSAGREAKTTAQELAQEYREFGRRTAERFREMTADDSDNLGDAYRDIGTAYRNKDRRDVRAIKKAAKETAREYKKFGKQVADIYRGSEEK